MAASITIPTSPTPKSVTQKGAGLIWLDDGATADPNAKAMFLTFYEQVFIFNDPTACLEVVESAEDKPPCITILVSGKYGQMLVPERLQPLNQVKDIYVYCFDIAKHSQWAQKCDKVRCVESDFGKILKRMQQDIQKGGKIKQGPFEQPQHHQQQQPEPMEDQADDQNQQDIIVIQEELERFTDDNNLYDYLAVELLLKSTNDNEGLEDFTKYCQENHNQDEVKQQIAQIKPDVSIKEWYKSDLFLTKINSTDLRQLWTLRWFIRLLHRQLTTEYEQLIKDASDITVNYGAWLTSDELDGMKHRIGQTIMFTELLMAYANRRKALDSIENKNTEQRKHKVIFEINIDKNVRPTNPYGQIGNDELLLWFGSRYRLMKIELIEEKNLSSYWLIGINLCSSLDTKQSNQTLYNYYLKILTDLNDLHHAYGRIFMYKGLYHQAEKWLETTNHYEDLTELAIRQYELERANQYVQNLPEDSNDANLFRAYIHLLTSGENIPKGRTLLMKICSEATDLMIRARANIALGYINLIVTQQIDQALDHFKLGSETFLKHLPDIHPDIAKSYIGIGYTYFLQQNFIESKKTFENALKIQRQSLIYNHPDIAKTRNGLAHCFSIDKQTIKQSLKECEHAFNILIQTYPKQYKIHPEILATKNDREKLRKGKELQARNILLDYI